MTGGYVGVIEEWFISKLKPGDVFSLAGRNLELVSVKDMTVQVRKSQSKKSIVPSWMGGRMPLTANLGALLRKKLTEAGSMKGTDHILDQLTPIFALQRTLSAIPGEDELLIELIQTKDGYHLFCHTFEGRLVNEAMAAILAWRISRIQPITFSFAMNDYSFELLSDQPIPISEKNAHELFTLDRLSEHIQQSVNATEMAKRKFRDIAVIGGLVFQGMPGEQKKARHLQSSSSLLFNVFLEYDPMNILLRQAFQEVMDAQMEESRLREMLQRISKSRIRITEPERLTPFSFPVKVDSMRESMSSERLEDRIRKMIADSQR
jgi:ATP-dependent Lhr-like helicase